ncbi:MAG: hypothetical protein EOP04_01795 [Proteobacteria bacterium]|nr:MAG: hypothetical protein EOP04_01795 [Pseudomonadota bacterium]
MTDWCIHGLGGISNAWDAAVYLIGLCYERMAYEEQGYDKGGQAITAKYWGLEDDSKIKEYNILDTPYCWNLKSVK